jgi:hypothetical protein
MIVGPFSILFLAVSAVAVSTRGRHLPAVS